MGLHGVFAISASGLAVEQLRLTVTALNLANSNSTRAGGALYQPLEVISAPRAAASFAAALDGAALAGGVEAVAVRPSGAPPRQVYEPGHPEADGRGFVAYPGINPVHEMVTMIAATRAYEANIAAIAAARTMALRALDIGSGS